MKPDIKNHNPDPVYISSLIDKSGFNKSQAAKLIGIDPRTMRRYCQSNGGLVCPYTVQFCLEHLND